MKRKRKEEGGREEGEGLPTHPREVELKRLVEGLQTRT